MAGRKEEKEKKGAGDLREEIIIRKIGGGRKLERGMVKRNSKRMNCLIQWYREKKGFPSCSGNKRNSTR